MIEEKLFIASSSNFHKTTIISQLLHYHTFAIK